MQKLELAVVGLTIAFAAFTAGYFIGNSARGEFSFDSEPEIFVETVDSDPQTENRTAPPSIKPSALPVSPSPVPEPAVFPININTAGQDELILLPGIGEKTAEKIIGHREKYGSFASIEDITNVDGIGQGTLDKIRNQITVGGP